MNNEEKFKFDIANLKTDFAVENMGGRIRGEDMGNKGFALLAHGNNSFRSIIIQNSECVWTLNLIHYI